MLSTLFLAAGDGFNPLDVNGGGNLLWTIIIFALALPFMWKLVMGPVTAALEERDDLAARAITAAEKAQSAAEKAQADVEVALGNAKTEAATMMAEARKRAEAREHEIVESAKAEAASMVESARKAIRTEQDKAISTIRNEVVDLSINAASRVLERNVGSEDDRRFVSDLVAGQESSRN